MALLDHLLPAWRHSDPEVRAAAVRELYHDTAIDYFHLLKVGDRWSIVSKLWDSEP